MMNKTRKIYFQYDFFLQFVIQLQLFSSQLFGKKNRLQEKFLGLSTENLLLLFFFIMIKCKLEIEGSRFNTIFPILLELIVIIGKNVLRIGNYQSFLIIATILNILYFLSQILFYVHELPKPAGEYKVGYTFFELQIKKQKVSLYYPISPKTQPIRGQKYPPVFPQKQDITNLSQMIMYFYLPQALEKIKFIFYFLVCQFFDYLLKIGIENVFINEKLINIAPELTQPQLQPDQPQEEQKIIEDEYKKQKLSKAIQKDEKKFSPSPPQKQQQITQYKIIIIETGLGSSRNQHSNLSKEFASQGFLVFSIQPDDNLDQFFIDPCQHDLYQLIAVRQTLISELVDFISFEEVRIAELLKIDFAFNLDKDNITIIGWQLGGASALYATQKLSQISAFIGLDPWLSPLNSTILNKPMKQKPILLISSQQFTKENYAQKNFETIKQFYATNVNNLDQSINCIFKQINHLYFTDLLYLIPIESKYFKGMEINQQSFENIFILNQYIIKYVTDILIKKLTKQEFQQNFSKFLIEKFPHQNDLFNIIKFIEN